MCVESFFELSPGEPRVCSGIFVFFSGPVSHLQPVLLVLWFRLTLLHSPVLNHVGCRPAAAGTGRSRANAVPVCFGLVVIELMWLILV